MPIANPFPHAAEQPEVAAGDDAIEIYPTPFLTPKQRADLRAQWKALIAKHTADKAAWKGLPGTDRAFEHPPALPAYAHMLYAVLLGRDWRKGFTRQSNRCKLANGALCSWRYWRAAYYFRRDMIAAVAKSPEEGAKTAPFHLFVDSVPVTGQLAAVCRLPEMPQSPWGSGYTVEKLTAEWPTAPYQEGSD